MVFNPCAYLDLKLPSNSKHTAKFGLQYKLYKHKISLFTLNIPIECVKKLKMICFIMTIYYRRRVSC